MGVVLVPVSIVAILFLAVSGRLFRSAFRTAGPEGWLAAFFLAAAIAMPARVLLVQAHGLDSDTRIATGVAIHGLLALGLCAFTVFVVHVFRPESWTAWLGASLVIGVLMLGPLALIFVGAHRGEDQPVGLCIGATRGLPFLWGLIESVRYYAQMRRRLALGLADPVVANRFLLFSIWNGGLFALMSTTLGLRAWALAAVDGGLLSQDDPTALVIRSLLHVSLLCFGVAIAISLWLSFFPPSAWLRRLQLSAPAASDTPA